MRRQFAGRNRTYPRHHILADLAACDGHAGARQEGLLAGRQRVVLILTCTDLELPSAWIIRRNHVALRRGVVIERREQFIAQADVQRQLWRHLPVILYIKCCGVMLLV